MTVPLAIYGIIVLAVGTFQFSDANNFEQQQNQINRLRRENIEHQQKLEVLQKQVERLEIVVEYKK